MRVNTVVFIIFNYMTYIATFADSEKKLKAVNIWQSYKQERDCIEHSLRLLAVWLPRALSARGNHFVCSFAKYSPI